MTEPLRRRVILGLALGAALKPCFVAKAAGERTMPFTSVFSSQQRMGPVIVHSSNNCMNSATRRVVT